MARVLLRLLLIVSLVMNGVAAPRAMAAMTHHHGGHAHAPAMAEAGAKQHAHAAMGHHDMASTMDSHGAHAKSSCCDGMFCSCGCVLPPMIALPVLPALAKAWSEAPARTVPALLAAVRTRPPLRPPTR
jgi:hypothetical protein